MPAILGASIGAVVFFGLLGSFVYCLIFYLIIKAAVRNGTLEAHRIMGGSPSSLATDMEHDEKLKALIQMRDNNLITEDEYEAKRQELANKRNGNLQG